MAGLIGLMALVFIAGFWAGFTVAALLAIQKREDEQ